MSEDPDFVDRNAQVAAHYTQRALQFGNSPRSGQWRDASSMEKRIEVLFEIGDLSGAKLLDFGCGIGGMFEMLPRLGFMGEYVGWDIADGMLDVASERFPGVRFERVDIHADQPTETFDYVLANGIFNNRFGNPQAFLKATLPLLFKLARKGLAFNLLSVHTKEQVPDLIYLDPAAVVDWVRKNLGPLIVLRSDYVIKPEGPPEDFTLFVYKEPPRRY
jgi:SAM-dependent methyltransferase